MAKTLIPLLKDHGWHLHDIFSLKQQETEIPRSFLNLCYPHSSSTMLSCNNTAVTWTYTHINKIMKRIKPARFRKATDVCVNLSFRRQPRWHYYTLRMKEKKQVLKIKPAVNIYLSTQKKRFSRTLSYINKVLSLHVISTIESDEQDYRPITESPCLRFFFYFRSKNEGVKSILFHIQTVKMQMKKFCIEFQEIYAHCFGLAEIRTKTHIK